MLTPNLVISLALVAAGATFEELKKDALALDRPANAIRVLVGACETPEGAINGECLENVKDLKNKVSGKRVALDLGAGYDQLLGFEGRRGAGKARFVWAPLYDVGNGLAMTVGKPQKINADGNVVVARRPVDGTAPDELSDFDLQRMAKSGGIGIELVGKFGKPWTMGKVKGVLFEVEAMRLYNSRTGATVFESTQPLK